MRIITDLVASELHADTVLTVGSFDGVHRGHQHLVRQLVARARETGRLAVALSFHPHPRSVLHPESRPSYLSTPKERAQILDALGLDVMALIEFTPELANTRAHDFVRILYQRLRMREMWVGPDFTLGYRQEGDARALRALGETLGFDLHIATPLTEGGQPISSTRIRQLLADGQVEQAAQLLGRPYSMAAEVIPGDQRGRKLGFRTANLRLDPTRAMPADGVYAVWALVGAERYPAVANLGVRPSFGEGERLLEAHLLDYQGDLYGQCLAVEFVSRLRPEQRFSDADALIEQIRRDVASARALLGQTSSERQP